MDAWQSAVQFLLVDDRAQVLADAHPLTEDRRCGRCTLPGCTAAALAAEALALLSGGALSVTTIEVETMLAPGRRRSRGRIALPTLTAEQRAEALKKAQKARACRKHLLDQVKSGEVTVAQVLDRGKPIRWWATPGSSPW
jgi:hypothetical protein